MRLLAFLVTCSAVITTIVAEISAVRTRSRALYGEFCDNRAVRCDSSLSLTCKNQTCACIKPETMTYDGARGACAAFAGEKCRYTVLDEYRSWQEEIMCVSNAHCDFTQSVCKCDRNYIELANGTCIPKKNCNESCETNTDCRQDLSLICQNSKCVCNPATSEYHSDLNQCVGLANEPCVNDLCTANAICREESRRTYYRSSSEESEEEYGDAVNNRDPASIGRCQCRTAFGVTTDGRCLLGYGGNCDHHKAKCMDGFKCKEGTCVCQYPTHQVYDKNAEACLSYVGGPCANPELKNVSNKTKTDCVGEAVCSRMGDTSRYQCTCPTGYIENKDKGCDLDYGQACRTVTASLPPNRQVSSSLPVPPAKCDKIGKLFCIDGKCQCEDDLHTYDRTSRTCRGLVGATCQTKKGHCAPGAYCQPRRGSFANNNNDLNVEGICTCQEFYREADDRTCSPKAQTGQEPALITLKSGGSEIGRRRVPARFNSTMNSIWAIFDHGDDD